MALNACPWRAESNQPEHPSLVRLWHAKDRYIEGSALETSPQTLPAKATRVPILELGELDWPL
jgi:hypothetical protein